MNYYDLVKQVKSKFQDGGSKAEFDYINKFIEENPNSYEAYRLRSEMNAAIGAFERSLDDVEKAIKINPNEATVYYNRGVFYINIYLKSGGDINKPLSDFNKAIELNANYVDAYINRANMYLRMGEFQKVIADCTKAIEISPEIIESYYNRGQAYMKTGEIAKAFDDYNMVIKLDPDDATAYLNKLELEELQNKEQERKDQEEIDRFCKEYGNDINAVDEDGETLLHKAVGHNRVTYKFWDIAVIKFLYNKRADVNKTNKSGCTPLYLATLKQNVEAVKFFISVKGIDVNVPDKSGCTPLHRAVSNKHIEICKILVSVNGIKINTKRETILSRGDIYVDTPLYTAVSADNVELVDLLVSKGADLNEKGGIKEICVQTPFEQAKQSGSPAMIEYLELIRKKELPKSEKSPSPPTKKPVSRKPLFIVLGGILILLAGIIIVIKNFTNTATEAEKATYKEAEKTEKREIATTTASDNFTDPRDYKTYKTVAIGTQIWMADNLNDATKGGVCYNNDPANCDKYGRLYDWDAARNACPKGWHLPSDKEWTVLMDFVGSNAGKKLKAINGWDNDGNGDDAFGFSALPGGWRNSDGSFSNAGDGGYWWSSTEYNIDKVYGRGMRSSRDDVYRNYNNKIAGFSVRCLGDAEDRGSSAIPGKYPQASERLLTATSMASIRRMIFSFTTKIKTAKTTEQESLQMSSL